MKKYIQSNRLLLILYPDIRILDIAINNNIFLNALSITTSLLSSNFYISNNYSESSKIILVDCKDNYIIIIKNVIVVKMHSVINILEDPELKLHYFIIKELSNKYFKEVKYYFEVAKQYNC